MSKLTIDDISYNDIAFYVSYRKKQCIPVSLTVFKNNKYILYTSYKSCRPNQNCNAMLEYTKSIL